MEARGVNVSCAGRGGRGDTGDLSRSQSRAAPMQASPDPHVRPRHTHSRTDVTRTGKSDTCERTTPQGARGGPHTSDRAGGGTSGGPGGATGQHRETAAGTLGRRVGRGHARAHGLRWHARARAHGPGSTDADGVCGRGRGLGRGLLVCNMRMRMCMCMCMWHVCV